jgi:hypothetical protein
MLLVLLCRRKELLHFGLHIHLEGQYFTREKLALLNNLNFTEVYFNFEKVCYLLSELYFESVYLNLFWWRGHEVHETFKWAQTINVWESLPYTKRRIL